MREDRVGRGASKDRSRAASDGPVLDRKRLGELLAACRPRLLRMLELRMDPQLRARVDASDVLQEAFLEVTRRACEYREDPARPFFVWARYLTAQKLVELQRRHLGAQRRD